MRMLSTLLLVLLFSYPAGSSIRIVPTTTLAAQTANNTSASSSYNQTSTGNVRPGNVSKHPMRSLLYAGSTTKIYAQLQGWLGGTNHLNVGYASNNATQVKLQVTDAMERGIQGFILDWYGPDRDPVSHQTAWLLKAEAERRYGFTYAIQEDVGALWDTYNRGGDVTGKLINDLNYAYYNFTNSPAYQRINGRPALYLFDVNAIAIDWGRVRAKIPSSILLIERYRPDYNAYARWFYDGAYAWPIINMGNQYDWGQAYLANYYWSARSSSKHDVGSTFKGFNDNLARWRQNRVINQQCGAVWVNTWKQINALFNSGSQLEATQIATWNDYEEGSEIETGIDPCLSINASLSDRTLNFWPSGSGSEGRAVAYYSIFVSADGHHLMKLTDVAAGMRSINLASYDFGSGTYYFHVKLQAKPGFQNRMSAAVRYVVGSASSTGNHISVTSPMPSGVTVASPMHVLASATAAHPPIKVMQIWLDGKKTYEALNTASVDKYLSAARGTHTLTVQAYDANYAYFNWRWSVNVK